MVNLVSTKFIMKMTLKNFLGLVLNMVGGMMYSWVKYHEGERKKRDKLSGDTSNPGNTDAANNEVSSALSPLNE